MIGSGAQGYCGGQWWGTSQISNGKCRIERLIRGIRKMAFASDQGGSSQVVVEMERKCRKVRSSRTAWGRGAQQS